MAKQGETMTTIELPIGATADTLKRCICNQLADLDPTIFDAVPHGDAAGVLLALLRTREDVKIVWN